MSAPFRNFVPQPGPQWDLLTVPVRDLLFGGARGGGKSYGMLGHYIAKAERTVRHYGQRDSFNGILVRRTLPELEDMILKAHKIFQGIGEWKDTKKTYVFPKQGVYGGATLKFRYLEKDKDAERYQGHEYQWVGVEEGGNFPSPAPINKMRATLRSGTGVDCYFLMTANPGGPGHNHLKADYIIPAPPNTPFIVRQEIRGRVVEFYRMFIPSKLEDNKLLMENDPDYVARVVAATNGQEWLARAWLDGDWDIVAGGMFDDLWDAKIHVLQPFKIPRSWRIYRAFDWGSSKPFSVGWWAESDGSVCQMADGTYKTFPPRTLFRIDEWYGWNGVPDTGLKMLEIDIAKGIKQRETTRGWDVIGGPADTMIFDVRNGECLADHHRKQGIYWQAADKSPGSRITGWQEIRGRLQNSRKERMEDPGLFVFDSCRQFIRTFPVAQRDKNKPDDVDTDTEDHILDETRYMVRHKPNTVTVQRLSGL